MSAATLTRQAGRALTALATAASLIACGGGGGSAEPLPTPDVSPVAVTTTASALPATPHPWQQGVFMEVFVRAYQDSNGDGIGDLRGLTSRLDYLKDLGITGLWLMPIQPSQDGDHGYAVTDYRAVAPEYGTLADLDELLAQAHARGIGVILDYVMNHSAAQHPLFRQSASGGGNPWRDWYVWQDSPPSGWNIYGSNPWRGTVQGSYFAPFWDQMPDFNLKNPTVVGWHHDNLRFWLNRGVDGFRFDAVGNLVENGASAWNSQPENHVLMKGVADLARGYDRRYIVCEAPDAPQRFGAADSCGNAFAFTYQYDLVDAVKGNAAALGRVAAYWQSAPEGMASFASNHDGFAGARLWDQFGGNTDRMKLAAATYLLQAKTAFVYYGEEIGMANGSLTGDPALRTPMSWTADGQGFSTGRPFRSASANRSSHNVAAQTGDANSLLNFYRQVIGLRQALPALATGRYAEAASGSATLQFRRIDDARGETVWVGLNYGDSAATVNVAGLAAGTRLQRHWPAGAGDVVTNAAGVTAVALPARSLAVFRLVAPSP